MARLSDRSRIEQLTDEWEPLVREAFLAGVDDLRSQALIGVIAERLEKGDVEGALRALNLDPAAFRALDTIMGQAFAAGGLSTVGALPVLRDPSGGRLVVRFDARNLRAEAWLRAHSSTLITGIVEDQRMAIRAALLAGMEEGRNPRSVALDIVGRIDPVRKRRVGGIVGLTSAQATFVAAARAELLSGDPAQLRSYLERQRRDSRFDRTVRTAIDGRPLTTAQVARMVARYADRLLELRGETIARTETMAALNQAAVEALTQAIEDGKLRSDVVSKVWHTAADFRVRHTHRGMSGQSVGLQAQFRSPSGVFLAYPGDPSAPAAEVVNCRCWMEPRIDFLAGIR